MREPKKPTKAIRFLAKRVREDTSFASLVSDLREIMDDREATPTEMRAALRFVLRVRAWAPYKRANQDMPMFRGQDADDVENTDQEEAR